MKTSSIFFSKQKLRADIENVSGSFMLSEICLIIGCVADEKKQKKTCRECWEESLMASSSLSQVFLHLSTLEQSILWSKSILNARCRICRRKGDAEAMLLCDYCDRGHHMYCLKPPLKVRFPFCHFVGYLPSLSVTVSNLLDSVVLGQISALFPLGFGSLLL